MLSERRAIAQEMISVNGVSVRRACFLTSMSRSVFSYQSCKREDANFVKRVIAIKEQYPFYGVPRVLATLRREGFVVNAKKVRRVMRTLRFIVARKQTRKRFMIAKSTRMPEATEIDQVWAIDFVFDRLINGTPFRCFTIIDTLSRRTPGILIRHSMEGFMPMKYLQTLQEQEKLPKHIVLDNGPEFVNEAFIAWSERNNINLHFIDKGKPVQNAYIESFNGKFREEFLKQNKFTSIEQARQKLKVWIEYYNEQRPHSSLDYLTPKEFVEQARAVLTQKKNLLVLKTG